MGVSLPLTQRHSASSADIQRGRRLRAQMTDAEIRLWARLRRGPMKGHHFRRQVPMGPYVVDFACLGARLLIEVDGGQHVEDIERDNERTAWLKSQGFRVLRFWNNDVLQRTEVVLEMIRAVVLEIPPPCPPHKGEGD
ncbi:MAG TPA: endonuclease domain-containing protein [Candidatus Eisenbacteria bacterium]|nr:endonuclease domain-containing protein [Candidatus Eisenbacteria bacterium]